MGKRLIVLLAFLVVGLGLVVFAGYYFESRQSERGERAGLIEDEETDIEGFVPYNASFEIYTNGLKRDFSAAMYLNQDDRAFLDESGALIVADENVAWQEFFGTLPFELTRGCLMTGTGGEYCDGDGGQLSFFLNGKPAPGVLDMTIGRDDHLVVRFE